LLRIEEELGSRAKYGGMSAFKLKHPTTWPCPLKMWVRKK
jgi:hypothetical protein